jgi:hypothetical protein
VAILAVAAAVMLLSARRIPATRIATHITVAKTRP